MVSQNFVGKLRIMKYLIIIAGILISLVDAKAQTPVTTKKSLNNVDMTLRLNTRDKRLMMRGNDHRTMMQRRKMIMMKRNQMIMRKRMMQIRRRRIIQLQRARRYYIRQRMIRQQRLRNR